MGDPYPNPTTWVSGTAPAVSAANLNKIEGGLVALAAALDSSDTTVDTRIATAIAPYEYGTHLIVWNGSAWRYRGATVTVRPTNVPAYNDGGLVIWDTTQDATVTTPPSLAIDGDLWRPHGSAVVVLT